MIFDFTLASFPLLIERIGLAFSQAMHFAGTVALIVSLCRFIDTISDYSFVTIISPISLQL